MSVKSDLTRALHLLKDGRLSEAASLIQHRLGALVPGKGPAPLRPASQPGQGQFLSRVFDSAEGRRPYKLYVPARRTDRHPPLIVMLHGCGQSADDFAAGTRMNQQAELHGCLVAWPQQVAKANLQRCWNWFQAENQHHGRGEPSIIAGITQAVMNEHAIDPARVYVAGLSAGGALAAIMADAYPELYAAVGIHSGLACGAAHDMKSALAAMATGGPGRRHASPRRLVPTIIFHGDSDKTVNPENADAVTAQALQGRRLRQREESGRASGGHAYRRIVWQDAAGRVMVEQWRIHGGGHAWFGGAEAGTYTDPRPPDATAEMLRFFMQHRLTP